MIGAFALLLSCQFLGELLARKTGLPVPGPVFGMVLLFLLLLIRRGVPASLDSVGGGLLSHMSVLFVPAGVGVMVHLRLIAAEWLPIAVALLLSTLLTMGVTALVMKSLDSADDGSGKVSGCSQNSRPPEAKERFESDDVSA
ncbi:MAG: CidA/LrgA family protein [Alphaproteobacteria bacterium]